MNTIFKFSKKFKASISPLLRLRRSGAQESLKFPKIAWLMKGDVWVDAAVKT